MKHGDEHRHTILRSPFDEGHHVVFSGLKNGSTLVRRAAVDGTQGVQNAASVKVLESVVLTHSVLSAAWCRAQGLSATRLVTCSKDSLQILDLDYHEQGSRVRLTVQPEDRSEFGAGVAWLGNTGARLVVARGGHLDILDASTGMRTWTSKSSSASSFVQSLTAISSHEVIIRLLGIEWLALGTCAAGMRKGFPTFGVLAICG
eukprot:TRINITY_DN23095_c0_g1_i11.p1 TRINITY_DN23095_c0_g1~~TRINITY_DN23095_c0_g1_i11.p1  ORF type:complete len:203 (-),score=11.07 TRINITY_DN23095_c0_g1_i11:73-681(-)